MSLQMFVTFPGKMNLGDFAGHLDTLKKLGCTFQLSEDAVPIHVSKSVAGRQFNRALKFQQENHVELTEELSANEEKVLDQVMARAHNEGTSPLLDELTRAKVGKLKPNMSREIVDYYRQNPGHTSKQGAGFLAEKFAAHFDNDVNEAFKRIRNLINTICYSNTAQKTLEKRGGKPGRGNDGQVFALEG